MFYSNEERETGVDEASDESIHSLQGFRNRIYSEEAMRRRLSLDSSYEFANSSSITSVSSALHGGSMKIAGNYPVFEESPSDRTTSGFLASPQPLGDKAYSAKDTKKLITFVPRQLIPILKAPTGQIDAGLQPVHRTCFSIVMLADVSGFTKLSETFCAMGPEGVDRLSELISDFLGQLIRLIQSFNGDIVGFAGDALIITWPTAETGTQVAASTNCVEQILRVFKCGLELSQMTHEDLSLHIGISSGLTTFCVLGGDMEDAHWCCLVVGEPILRMGDAERYAGSKQVVATKETYQFVDTFCEVEEIEEQRIDSPSGAGSSRKRGLVLLNNVTKPESMAWKPNDVNAELQDEYIKTHEFSAKLRRFIPSPAMEVLRANGQYLNEYRKRISVLFVMLDDFPIDIYNPASDGQRIQILFQELLCDLQQTLASFDGFMRQFIIDDKGCVFIACFGVAGHAHRDDPCRALNCGLAIAEACKARKIRTFTGLTTGAAFCGAVGSADRREYAMIGKDVNLAARLMSLARKLANQNNHFSMLVLNESTYNETKSEHQVRFEQLEPVKLKGSEKEVTVYNAKYTESSTFNKQDLLSKTRGQPLVGRQREYTEILQLLKVDETNFGGRVCVVEGRQGLGKSCIVQNIRNQIEELDILSIYVKALENNKDSPYIVFRQIFWQLLECRVLTLQQRKDHRKQQDIESLRKELFLDLLMRVGEVMLSEGGLASKHLKTSERNLRIDVNSAATTSKKILTPSKKAASPSSKTMVDSRLRTGKGKTEEKDSESVTKRRIFGSFSNEKRNEPSYQPRHFMKKGRRSSDPFVGRTTLDNNIRSDPGEEDKPRKRSISHANGINKSDQASEVQVPFFVQDTLFPLMKNLLGFTWKLDTPEYMKTKKSNTGSTNIIPPSGPHMLRVTLRVLMHLVPSKKIIIFIDDAEHVDSLSGRALSHFLKTDKRDMCIVLTRKPSETDVDWESDLAANFQLVRVEVKPLGREDIFNLIDEVVGEGVLAENVKNFIFEQSNGNPAHAFELAKSFQESEDEFFVENKEMIVEHAIQARFDRLPDTHRALLKTAAVIGYVFPHDCLMTMVPRCISRKGAQMLTSVLSDLVESEWLDILYDETLGQMYHFRSDQARDICYNLNPSRNLKSLHLMVAQYFEKTYDEDLRPYFSLLAHHYRESQNDSMALKFLVYSFRLDLNIGAMQEAHGVLGTIINLNIEPSKLKTTLEDIVLTLRRHRETGNNMNIFQDAFMPQNHPTKSTSSGTGSMKLPRKVISEEERKFGSFGLSAIERQVETAIIELRWQLELEEKREEEEKQAKSEEEGKNPTTQKSAACVIL